MQTNAENTAADIQDDSFSPVARQAASLKFASADLHSAVSQFLVYEAILLDEDRLTDWLTLLDEEFIYEVPIRVDRVRTQGGNRFEEGNYRLRDTKAALAKRIERLLTGHAWAEELASRTCRLVGSVAVTLTESPTIVHARSSVFIYRQRGPQLDAEVIPARHEDEIFIGGNGEIRLMRRTVLLAEKSLSTNNLAIFV